MMWVEAGVLHYMGHNAHLPTLARTSTADHNCTTTADHNCTNTADHNYQTRVKEVRSKDVIHYDNWQA